MLFRTTKRHRVVKVVLIILAVFRIELVRYSDDLRRALQHFVVSSREKS
jgi:hypothetical protein